MRTRLGVLTNLRAGSRGDGKPRARIEVPRDPDVVHLVTESSEHLPDALTELAAKEVGVIAINGGDGTLHHTLTELMRHRPFERHPFVAPLRGGRTNMAALDFGAARSPHRSVRRLLDACRRGALEARRVDRPLLRITTDAAGPVFGFFVGTGVVRRATEFIHRVFPPGRARGVFGGGVTTASVLLQAILGRRNEILHPDKHQIVLDGETVEPSEYLIVMATSLNRLILRIRPFWGESSQPVRFTAIDWNASHLGSAAWRVAAGRAGGARSGHASLSRERGYLSRNVSDAVIRHDCGFTIDGELFPSDGEGSFRIGATREIPFLRG